MTFKAIEISLKFQRKGKSYQWNKTNLTNSLIYRIKRMASASVRRSKRESAISDEGRKYSKIELPKNK